MGMQRFVNNCAEQLMARRNVLLGFFLLVTLALGYSATPVRLDPGFNKQIPVRHAYMLNFLDFSRIFTGANRLLVNVWARSSCFRCWPRGSTRENRWWRPLPHEHLHD